MKGDAVAFVAQEGFAAALGLEAATVTYNAEAERVHRLDVRFGMAPIQGMARAKLSPAELIAAMEPTDMHELDRDFDAAVAWMRDLCRLWRDWRPG